MKRSNETSKGSVNLSLVSVEREPEGRLLISRGVRLRQSLGNVPALDLPSKVGVQRPQDDLIAGSEQLVVPEIILESTEPSTKVGQISVRAVDFQAMKEGEGELSPVVYASPPVFNPIDVGALVCFMSGDRGDRPFSESEVYQASVVASQPAVTVAENIQAPSCEVVVVHLADDFSYVPRFEAGVVKWVRDNAHLYEAAQ